MHGFILVCLINSYAGGWAPFQTPYVVSLKSKATCFDTILTLDSELDRHKSLGYGKCKCIAENDNV